jgi:prepilin-type N-terminal cleavage/methylation domain-containing protein
MTGVTVGRKGPSEASGESGFTLVELLMGATVLAIGICGLAVTLVYSMTLAETNRESAEARIAAKEVMERVRAVPVEDIFATFNGVTDDDPESDQEVPGGTFVVTRSPLEDLCESYTAQIEFPTGEYAGYLREDIEDPLLGMPRDLNGDGTIDSEDHSDDYQILPLRVRVLWRGKTGPRSFEVCTVLLRQ